MTKLHTLLILLLAAPFARADISFVHPMSPAECKQAVIDSMEMYADSRYCEKADTEQTRRQALLFAAMPESLQPQNNGWTHFRLTGIGNEPISFYSDTQMLNHLNRRNHIGSK